MFTKAIKPLGYIGLSEMESDFLCLQRQTYQPRWKDKFVGVIYKDNIRETTNYNEDKQLTVFIYDSMS